MTHYDATFSPDFWAVIAALCAAPLPGGLRQARRSGRAWLLLPLLYVAGLSVSLWTLAAGNDGLLAEELVAVLASTGLAAFLAASALHIKKIAV